MKTRLEDNSKKFYQWKDLPEHIQKKIDKDSPIGTEVKITGTVFAEISDEGISFYTTMWRGKHASMTLSDLS